MQNVIKHLFPTNFSYFDDDDIGRIIMTNLTMKLMRMEQRIGKKRIHLYHNFKFVYFILNSRYKLNIKQYHIEYHTEMFSGKCFN